MQVSSKSIESSWRNGSIYVPIHIYIVTYIGANDLKFVKILNVLKIKYKDCFIPNTCDLHKIDANLS